ncbi:MAG: cytosolic factor, phosphatidylinositol/phosphatidylcholine transfer protein [Alyxoria varia]|nr:MAG: cytosolic factor, phosphatidylinositol/phosphatidylcholine transfer protein [Alyxoria varia]
MAAAPQKRPVPLDAKYDNYDHPVESIAQQSGHPGFTTEQQDAQLAQLRMMLESAGYKERLDTLTLLRFLRARKFNVEASKQMFVDCEKWRKEFQGGVDDLVRNFDYKERPQVFEYYPQYYHKIDKDGRPIYIEQLGKIDLNAMYKITTSDRMLSNLVVEYEKNSDPRLPACSRLAGHLLETGCTIMDLKGVGLSKASSVYSYVGSASAISQNYYPERLGKLYVINAPWGFSGVFGVVKRFLDPVTVNKIHILGSNYEKELLAQVPAENLPKTFGGKCECPGGCMFSDQGPWHDAKYTKTPWWAKEKSAAAADGATQGQGGPGVASAGTAADGATDGQGGVTAEKAQNPLATTESNKEKAARSSAPDVQPVDVRVSEPPTAGAGAGAGAAA